MLCSVIISARSHIQMRYNYCTKCIKFKKEYKEEGIGKTFQSSGFLIKYAQDLYWTVQ